MEKAWRNIPAGACLLKKQPLRLNGGSLGALGEQGSKNITFGVFRSPEEFVESAVAAGHPVGRDAKLPAVLAETIEFVSNNSLKAVASLRVEALKFWLDRAKALSEAEKSLHDSLHPSLRGILAPKRLLLWKNMLEYYGYPDCDVFNDRWKG